MSKLNLDRAQLLSGGLGILPPKRGKLIKRVTVTDDNGEVVSDDTTVIYI